MIRATLRRHPVLLFIAVTFALTVVLVFLAFSPAIGLSGVPQSILKVVAKFSPTLGGIIVSFLLAGSDGVRALLAPLTRWNVSARWYAITIGGPIAVVLTAIGITGVIGDGNVELGSAPAIALAAALIRPIVLGGGLGEEIGWRGFMLPHLQQRFSPIVSSVQVGLCWGLWHTPAFFISGTGKTGGIASLVVFTLFCVVLSLLFTWAFNGSGGSLLIVVLMHGCINGSLDTGDLLFPDLQPDLVAILLFLLVAVVLTVKTRLGKAGEAPITAATQR